MADMIMSQTPVQTVDNAILGRRSVRAFRQEPVDLDLVRRLLELAARAPSGTNMQPWRVYVLTGDARQRLVTALLAAHEARASQAMKYKAEYKYYPDEFFEPYLGRRRKVGWGLYNLLGIKKGDQQRMHEQHARNFKFFDAPVGLIFTIDRRLEIGSWLDYGMFLQSLMLAARAHGLDTCPQAAFAAFHTVIRTAIADIDENDVVVCGMALGYADNDAPENLLVTERATTADFSTFLS